MQPLVNCYTVSFHNLMTSKETGDYYVVHDRIPELSINLGKRDTLLVAETHLRAVDCYGGGIADKKLFMPAALWVGSVSKKMNGGDARRGFSYRTVEVKDANISGNGGNGNE